MQTVVIHAGFPKGATKFLSRKVFKFHPEIKNFGKVDGLWDVDPKLLETFQIIMHSKKVSANDEVKVVKTLKNLKLKKNKINFISYEGFLQLNFTNNHEIIFERIKKYFLKSSINVKIFVTIRSQVEMIPKHYANSPKLYAPFKIKNFRGFISRIDSKKDKFNDEFKKIFSRYEYHKLYLCLSKLFGKNNFKFFLLEDLRLNNKLFFKELCNFLKINNISNDLFQKNPENVTRKRDNEYLRINKYLIKKLYNSFFFKAFLIPFPLSIRKKIYIIVANTIIDIMYFFDTIKLDGTQIKKIKKHYRKENLKLYKVLKKEIIKKNYL